MRYHQGVYKPINPSKWITNGRDIIFRSGLEFKVFSRLDANPSVLKLSSEEIVVPYLSPIDNKYHRYFVDLYTKIKQRDGSIKEMLIEIKPESQTREPKKQSNITKAYIHKVEQWLVNEAKWKAAKEFCKNRGWEFKFITEKNL